MAISLKTLSADQLLALIQAGGLLVNAGIMVSGEIAAFIKNLGGPPLTEAELNAICDLIINDANSRKLAAQAEVDKVQA